MIQARLLVYRRKKFSNYYEIKKAYQSVTRTVEDDVLYVPVGKYFYRQRNITIFADLLTAQTLRN